MSKDPIYRGFSPPPAWGTFAGSSNIVNFLGRSVGYQNPDGTEHLFDSKDDPELNAAQKRWMEYLNLPVPAEPAQYGINEDLGPHTGKSIPKRRFEPYTGLASGMR